MKIFVTVKQVPDTSGKVAVNPDGTLDRASMQTIINPDDMNAVEAALALKDELGCKVIAFTMGPPPAEGMLRELMAMGVDEGVLVTAREFGGSDTYATSQILAAAIDTIGIEEDDIVMCGRQAIDGDTAQVGPQIAEKLKMPQIAYVEEVIDLNSSSIKARRAIEGGYEILEAPLPCLLTVIEGNDPRPMAALKIMKFKKAKTPGEVAKDAASPEDAEKICSELKAKGLLIAEWNAEFVGADKNRTGLAGSPTKVKNIQSVILTASEAKSVEPTDEGINNLMHELIADHTLG